MKDIKEKSAIFFETIFLSNSITLSLLIITSYGNFQTSKNASPIFLLGSPRYKSIVLCTISAMELTNTITSSCKTSVASVNDLMSQKPYIAYCFLPGSKGFTSPLYAIFLAIISEPASPKPTFYMIFLLLFFFKKIRKYALIVFQS